MKEVELEELPFDVDIPPYEPPPEPSYCCNDCYKCDFFLHYRYCPYDDPEWGWPYWKREMFRNHISESEEFPL